MYSPLMSRLFDRVTCNECTVRLDACPRNEHGYPLASFCYDVGASAGVSMGHQHYHTPTGRTALCCAERRTDFPRPMGVVLAERAQSAAS